MRPLAPQQVQTIKRILEAEGNLRDVALFATAIDTMLRSVDLLRLTVEDVTDHEGRVRDEFTVRQRKTDTGNLVSLTPHARAALDRWIKDSRKVPHTTCRTYCCTRQPIGRPSANSWFIHHGSSKTILSM